MEKKLISEEIARFKLLSNYNSNLTLTENESKLEINEFAELGEQTKKQFLKIFNVGLNKADDVAFSNSGKNYADFIKGARNAEYQAAKNLLDKVTSKVGGITLKGGGVASSTDEILNALKAGTITANGLSNLAKGLLKSGSFPSGSPIRTALVDKAATLSIKTAQFADELSEKAIAKILKGKGYADDVADDIAVRIKSKQGGSPRPGPGPVPTPPPPPPPPKPWVQRLWANKTFRYASIAAAGAGGLALLQWWFSDGHKDPEIEWVPDCLKVIYAKGSKGLTEDDLKTLSEKGNPNMLPMANPNTVDSNGEHVPFPDSVFNKDRSFVSSKGKGNWLVQGDKIIINQDGNVYFIDCSLTINVTPKPVPPVPPVSGCKPCSGFPQGYYCRSSEIEEIQGCVGASVDGCLGPETARKTGEFLGTSPVKTITKDIYDQVKAKCGKSTTTTTTSITSGGDTSVIDNM